MTVIGWLQIALYCAIIVALVKPLGGYMTRVFNGERTFLSPVLRPLEAGLYRIGGVEEGREQHWLTYTVAMLLFQVGGFLIIYGLMRLQALLPFNPAASPPSRKICPSIRPSASSPTRTGRTTAARARCPILSRCSG